jgi:hypothetical protein
MSRRPPLAAILLLTTAGLLTVAPASAGHKRGAIVQGEFDGVWTVSIRTEIGPCGTGYRYPARIVRGEIVPAQSEAGYHISGVVVATGAVAVQVSGGGQNATGYGKLRGENGSGRWSAGQCSGSWSAERRS